jgi:hypothetical protein
LDELHLADHHLPDAHDDDGWSLWLDEILLGSGCPEDDTVSDSAAHSLRFPFKDLSETAALIADGRV